MRLEICSIIRNLTWSLLVDFSTNKLSHPGNAKKVAAKAMNSKGIVKKTSIADEFQEESWLI